jgi:predicted acylesterase/phospholipase RssA
MESAYAPRHDYGKPTKDCDLIMKGGITSGVIYPLAICKLAETYRLHSIGGASAGAIAASAAAAAEYARRAGRVDGYKKLEALPATLSARTDSGRTRLLSLFQPVPSTKPTFDTLLAMLGDAPAPWKVLRVARVIVRHHWELPLLGVLLAVALFAGTSPSGVQAVALAIAALLVLAASVIGAAVLGARRAYNAIAGNFGGICRGYEPMPPTDEPALCEWLADLIDDIAGKSGAPLTFGDLHSDDAAVNIELAMITTNLTHGRPYRLPFVDNATFWFDMREIRKLFPPRIAKYLEDEGRARLASGPKLLLRIRDDNDEHFLPLPIGSKLPVVFGVRLSLSFPVLLSAVPLYDVDWTAVLHPDLETCEELETESSRPTAHLPNRGPLVLSRCWFSDGGICSNLPIHFFDSLLPKHPTFALNLRPANRHFRFWKPGDDGSELDNVYVPESRNAGYAESWSDLGSALSPVTLLGAIADTMQNWNDNALAKAPGYRDRIIHISHLDTEGGMNLDMPRDLIERLSMRGAAAGYKIGARFEQPDVWSSHLWTRYRSALAMLQTLLGTAHERYFHDPKGREQLEALMKEPPCYHFKGSEAEAAARTNSAFSAFSDFNSKQTDFVVRAPRPVSELRPRPR